MQKLQSIRKINLIKIMNFLASKQTFCIPKLHKSSTFDTRPSESDCCEVLIKSRFFQTWNKHELQISLTEKMLTMCSKDSQKKKVYSLDEVTYSRNWKHEGIFLHISSVKSYQVRGDNKLQAILKELDLYHNYKKLGSQNCEELIPLPKKINYAEVVQKSNANLILKTHQKHAKTEPEKDVNDNLTDIDEKQIKQTTKPLHHYQRQKSYINLSDWRRDLKNGGILLINKQKKNILSQTISYTAKKVVEMGSITNVNLPTFGMKPESALETFCKCMGAAPVILEKTGKNPLERIKSLNAVVLSMSILFNDILKGFNPTLGETFQGDLGGNPVYAEQISSKPRNVSSFLLMGKDYRLFGSLELKADIGLNEATGVFYGEVVLEFDDGNLVRGIMPRGVVSGIMFGDIRFGPTGAVYSYDPVNKLVCSYETKKGDAMAGQIGKLRPQSQAKFERMLAAGKGDGFSHLSEKEYDMVLSRVQVVYSDSISYDGRPFFSYSEADNLPLRLTKDVPKNEAILPSDSSHREDIRLRRLEDNKQSQAENDRIEQDEEKGRKLRRHGSQSKTKKD